MTAGLASGCGTESPPPAPESQESAQPKPMAIYRDRDKLTVKLGDRRSHVESILTPDEQFVAQYEEYNTERVEYWDFAGIQVDYNASGDLFGIWLSAEGWGLDNGLSVGDTAEDVKAVYGESQLFQHEGLEDWWVAYDEQGHALENYDRESPYIVRFSIEGGKIDTIVIMDASYEMFWGYF